LVGKPEGKRLMGRPRHRWVVKIRMDLWEEGVYWIFVGKPVAKRPLGRPRCQWVYNIRMDLWGEKVYWVFVGKPEGKRPLGRPLRRWVDNIRMDLVVRDGCIVPLWVNRRERDHWWDLGVNRWTILGWIFGERAVYRVLVAKLERKRPLGRPRLRFVDNIRMGLWGEAVCSVLVGKPEGKRPLSKSRRRCVDNIRIDLW